MRKFLFLATIALFLFPGQTREVLAQADCSVPAIQAKAPKGTTITAASVIPAADKVRSYCRVDGHVAVPGNEVNFRLGLPTSGWNGKFYFSGIGGVGGGDGPLHQRMWLGASL